MIDENLIIADTGYLYALFNQNDPKYFLAQKLLERFEDNILITTCFVFAELYWLLRKKHFHLISKIYAAAGHEEIFRIVSFETSQLSILKTHSDKYQNRLIDIADASLISLAEKIGHGNILTTDSDFQVYRWNKDNSFKNLLVDS